MQLPAVNSLERFNNEFMKPKIQDNASTGHLKSQSFKKML